VYVLWIVVRPFVIFLLLQLASTCDECSFPWTRRMMHVEGEMHTISEGVSSPPVFSGGFVDQYFVFCAMFCRSLCVILQLASTIILQLSALV
jgi:hypothetical protein